MKDTYKCAMCKVIFNLIRDESWNEEKAIAELTEVFGESLNETHVRVCDDCYNIIHPKNNKEIFDTYMESKK